ncbi:MAG: transglycosylase domain-containing protein [Dehalococcoidia bacterium]
MNGGNLLMKAIIVLGGLAVLGGIIGGAASMVVYNSYAEDLVAPDELAINQPSYGARILDRTGKLLYEYVDDKSGLRRPVKIDNVAPSYLAATIATEDDSFFTNPGINIPGLLRAAWENTPFAGGAAFEGSGGSSITQQLVKNVYIPEEERQRREIGRKIKETVYAVELTNRYSKDQILEWYVNQISYGGVYNGVEAAAQGYFNKPANELTLAEAALLAGIPQSPAEYDPVNHPEAAVARRNDVLDIILRKGSVQIGEDKFFEVTDEEIAAAKAEPITISQKRFPIEAPHWVLQYIEPQLEELFPEAGALYTEGLVVTTTLDLDMQNQTLQIMEGWITEFENISDSHNGSMMVMDPRTGEILVMVGSRDYFNEAIQGKNNNATACNSPGSSFKPFAYLTTFLNLNWGPGTLILDTPVTYSDGVNGNFTPTNPNKTFVGPVSIRSALGSSLNIPANKAAAAVGPNKIVQLARSIGFKDTFNKCGATSGYGPAIATGGIDTTLEDMMVGYSVLANMGVLRGAETFDSGRAATLRQIDPVSILKVTDAQGVTRYDADQKRKEQRVAPAAETYEIASILTDSSAQCLVFGCGGISVRGGQAGVKTGTSEPFTSDSVNAGKIGETWAFAYSPDLVVGIWAGNSDNAPVVNIQSTSISFRSVRDVMQMAYQFPYIKSTSFSRPADVVDATICVPSGLKPTELCGKTVTDIFAKSSVPTQEDTWWQKVKIDARNQLLANASTPPQFVQEKVMLVPPKEAVDTEEEKKAMDEWAKALGLELAPTKESDGLPTGGAGDLNAFIISPSANSSIPLNSAVTIIGRATHQDFKSYQLEFGQGTSPNAFTRISEGTNAVVQGQLGQWNTAGLAPGAYTLRLVVIDKDNNRSSNSVIVYVGQNAPVVTTTTTPAPNTTPNSTPAVQPTATPQP